MHETRTVLSESMDQKEKKKRSIQLASNQIDGIGLKAKTS